MMRSITLTGALMTVALLAGAAQAAAQGSAPPDTAYLHVNFGVQANSRTLAQAGSFPLYDEDATFTSSTSIKGGPLFDIGGGYRVWHNMYVGISYSRQSDHSDASVNGSIPHPLFADQPRPVSGTANNLEHTENQVHLMALWRVPVTTQFDVGVFIGPTIFSVSQDVVTGINVTENGRPYTTVTLAGIQTSNESKTSVGFNIGLDGSYMFTPRLGAGVMLRYAHGSVDLPYGSSSVNLSAGGFQFGVGARVRF